MFKGIFRKPYDMGGNILGMHKRMGRAQIQNSHSQEARLIPLAKSIYSIPSTMYHHPSGIALNIVGLQESGNSRSCEEQTTCGVVVTLDTVLRLRTVQIIGRMGQINKDTWHPTNTYISLLSGVAGEQRA